MKRTLLQITAVVTLFAAGFVPPAEACINGVEMSRKTAVQLINQAEVALAEGNARAALILLDRKLGIDELFSRNAKLEQRLERLWAVARLRAGEAADIGRAIKVLREQLETEKANPWLKVRLAEALSRTTQGIEEARQLLEELAKQDLIVDPEGFATLATLRKRAKDLPGAEQAMTRCKAMAKKPAVCSDTPEPIDMRPRKEMTIINAASADDLF